MISKVREFLGNLEYIIIKFWPANVASNGKKIHNILQNIADYQSLY